MSAGDVWKAGLFICQKNHKFPAGAILCLYIFYTRVFDLATEDPAMIRQGLCSLLGRSTSRKDRVFSCSIEQRLRW